MTLLDNCTLKRAVFVKAAILSFALLCAQTTQAMSESDNVLDFLPGILAAASGGQCDSQNLASSRANCTWVVDTDRNLNGESISLPAGVTVEFAGGSIRNGTLVFRGGKIDGRLLNSRLVIRGNARLIDPLFKFVASKWSITQGVVSDAVATVNRENIRKAINTVKALGGDTFEIDNIDAFLNVSTAPGGGRHDIDASIFIPSNFHFKMGGNCNLRVQPTFTERSLLISSVSTENIKISGGKLWGDRYTHDYTTIASSHDWGHLIMLRGVHNSVIDGVEIHEGVGDGIQIGGISHRFNDGTLKPGGRESKNVTVRNCLINDHRRNNISIVDGTDIYIEYNTIKNAGSGDDRKGVSSNGTSPRAGIDIEAFKNNAPDNNSVYDFEKTEDIHIRNNIFEDNYAVDVALYNGEKTYVYENTFRSLRAISAAFSFNNKIYNNNFQRPAGLMPGSQAINFEPRYWANGNHRIKDFEVYDNSFSGYQFAIVAGGQGHTFTNNKMINNQRGAVLITSEDLVFDNNIISSNVSRSFGYYTFNTGIPIKRCLVKNGVVNVQNKGLQLVNVNNDESGEITVDGVDFSGGGILLNSAQGITIKNSTFEDIEIVKSDPILLNNNL